MAHEGITDLLNEQGSELDKLSSELIKSYQKELELLARIQAQEEALEQLKRRENEARTEALRARQHLRVLQNSPLGRLQRKYWQLNRKGKR
jgi:DNA-binding protein H-NS